MKTHGPVYGEDYIQRAQDLITNGRTLMSWWSTPSSPTVSPSDYVTARCWSLLDAGMPGLTQGKPFKKMGMMSSPTGELFANAADRIACFAPRGTAATAPALIFAVERLGVAPGRRWASSTNATGCVWITQRPARWANIGQFQLIQ